MSLLNSRVQGNQVKNLDGRATVSGEYVSNCHWVKAWEGGNKRRSASQETLTAVPHVIPSHERGSA